MTVSPLAVHAWRALAATALLVPAGIAQDGATNTAAPVPGRDTITIADLREHVAFLADDKLEGRAAGTKGNERAAKYIADRFRKLGLERVAERGRSWYQDFEAKSQRYKQVDARNVAGFLAGTDETLKDEVIVIGAHYDHVGVGRFGSRERDRGSLDDKIHNGADDNASGTAGLLELAEAFAEHPPKRSILFLAFSAEELGLLGSYHYCAEPLLPLERTVAMFNFDMIGRSEDDYLFIGGVGTSPVWPELVRDHVESAGLAVERGEGGRAPSDNTPFYEKDVPVLFFFTNVHVDYHRVSDEAEFLNYGAQERIVRAGYTLIRAVADAEARPPFTKADGQGMPADFQSLMGLPSRARDLADTVRGRARDRIDAKGCGRLGFAPAAGRRGEVLIGELLAAGPAAAAGLDVGDAVLAVGDAAVATSREIAEALEDVDAGETVALRVRRGGSEETVDVVVGR